jgi:hypothetical protein
MTPPRPPLLLIVIANVGNFLGFAGILTYSCFGFWGRYYDGAFQTEVPLALRISFWAQMALSLALIFLVRGLMHLNPRARRLAYVWCVLIVINQILYAATLFLPETFPRFDLAAEAIIMAIWVGFSAVLSIILSLPRIARAFLPAPAAEPEKVAGS